MKRTISLLSIALGLIIGPWRPAFGDNPVLSGICASVDCLNNFTAKSGYSFSQKQMLYGGFTDLEQGWYVSPGIGFSAAKGTSPLVDVNAILKVGKLLTDKVPYIHDFIGSHPMTQGFMKYTTIGETGGYDYANGRWYDLSWVGATLQF